MKKTHAYWRGYGASPVTKLLMVMNFVAALILTCTMSVSAGVYSQDKKVSLSLKDVKLTRLFKAIEQSTSYRFTYSNDILSKVNTVTINVKDMPVSEVLNNALGKEGLKYRFIESSEIFVISKNVEAVAGKEAFVNKLISGKITNEKGEPLSGATISVKGSSKTVTSLEDGSFAIEVADDAKVLIISYVGYTSQEVNIEKQTTISVSMKPEATGLNDVVVVGYGSARKKDVTGAVSSISSKDFTQGLVTNPMDQIQGKVPGLVVTKVDGDPNAEVVLRLRGQTSLSGGQSPLLVLDGVILDDVSQISNIPPGDITSYDVLKDASATAIYGSRGANGVIIINTRKGRSGRMLVDYSGFLSFSKDAKKPVMLTTPEFYTEAQNLGVDPSTYDKYNSAAGVTNNWRDALLRTGISHSHILGITGGTDNFSYRGSVNYQDNQGIVINTGKQQYGMRFNAEQKAMNGKLTIAMGIVSTNTTRQLVNRDVFNWANVIPPYIRIKMDDGSDNPVYQYNYQNPVIYQNSVTNNAKEKLTQEYGTINYKVFKDLTAGLTGSISKFNTQGDYYLPVIPGANNLNAGRKTNANRDSKKGDIHLNYAKSIDKHNFTATGVYEYNYYTYDNFAAYGQGYVVDANENNALQNGNSSLNKISSYKEEYKIISFLARATYNYNSKYYLTASFRKDGSSKFGSNHRWGNFPSISAAWRLKSESFLKNVSWLDELKVSLGYGVVGNQDAIGAYNTLTTLTSAGVTYNPTNTNNPYPVGFTPNQNPNPDLVWEERHGKNLGVEFAMLKGRISGSLSVFNDVTKNLLYTYSVQVPPNFVPSVLANVGELTNKGVELQLNGDIIRNDKFVWSLGGQITTINTKVTSLSGTWNGQKLSTDNIVAGSASGRGLSANPITYLIVGKSPYTFYLPHYVSKTADGLSQFEKADGSLTTNYLEAQNKYIDPYPKFNYGFTTNFAYKSWALNAFFRGVSGIKIFNNTNLNLANYNNLPSVNTLKEAVTSGLRDNPTPSDYWLENASFLRLEALTVSYNLPKIKGIEGMRAYISGNNLFVITQYKGLDPEIATVNNSATPAFIDLTYSGNGGYYPKSRSITVGVNVSFK
ncbi:SusC/RagA family TonB-linked outer membrane protein [Flavihumibacter profundi]|uniref:SusC/RagA family TonB-linked outer membrane protein n=1 Tax=Flavihumibacter profundi TaxID=2716883 RepID=UPI001CC67103|nr:SusC/RagA family TonB-linked outer membrane protein [Flavihumibacter profundi]MBZ5856919.1 SusC/RagA family TonB-linked outer membrane protein [Flavihumibacter profundi]